MSNKELRVKLALLRKMLAEEFPTTREFGRDRYAFDFLAGPIPYGCYCEINSEQQAFIFRGVFSVQFPPERRSTVGEYLHRVNYEIAVGGWTINLDNGDIRWHSGFYFGESDFSDELM